MKDYENIFRLKEVGINRDDALVSLLVMLRAV